VEGTALGELVGVGCSGLDGLDEAGAQGRRGVQDGGTPSRDWRAFQPSAPTLPTVQQPIARRKRRM